MLSRNLLDTETSLFAIDDRGPVGLVILSGSENKRQLDLIAIRGDRRRRGEGGGAPRRQASREGRRL